MLADRWALQTKEIIVKWIGTACEHGALKGFLRRESVETQNNQ